MPERRRKKYAAVSLPFDQMKKVNIRRKAKYSLEFFFAFYNGRTMSFPPFHSVHGGGEKKAPKGKVCVALGGVFPLEQSAAF